MPYNTDYKIHYICHYCASFITIKKFDLIRHLTKQKRCSPMSIDSKISFEDACKLSENKKFYFDTNEIKNITQEEVQKYVDESIEQEMVEEDKIILGSKITDTKYQVMKINKEEFQLYFFDEKIQKYKCYECSSEFASKQLMENHILQKIKCEKVSKINEAIQRSKWKEKYNNFEKIDSILQKCVSNNVDLDHIQLIIDEYIKFRNQSS
jgi:hypothetical protein